MLLSCSAMLEFDQHSWSPITGSSQPPYSHWMFVSVSLGGARLSPRHSSQDFLVWGHCDPALGKITYFYLFSLDFDQEKSWCCCIIPKSHPPFCLFVFKEHKAIWYNRLCFVWSYFCILGSNNIHNKHRLGLLVENLPLFLIGPFLFLCRCLNLALLKIIEMHFPSHKILKAVWWVLLFNK